MTTADGVVQSRRARSTGTQVTVYDGIPSGFDIDGGRWQTVCDPHGFIVSHETRALAVSFASAPEQWCEVCSGNINEDGTDADQQKE
jgi:hypothetical protein